MAVVRTCGEMGRYMLENGFQTRCMEKDNLNGQMESTMKVSLKMTRDMVMAYSFGLMEEYMMECGKTESSMEEVFLNKQTGSN